MIRHKNFFSILTDTFIDLVNSFQASVPSLYPPVKLKKPEVF